ncbi:MAG: MBL fold metallo-hydrolase [Ktedonobacteraceae bacterium]
MEITWLGHSCFQLRGKNVTLITDPFSPQHGEASKLSKINASIVTVSHNHIGHNYVEGVAGIGGKQPRVVRSPGEYEISDVLITGVASYHDNKRGQEQGRNTIYIIHIDDIAVCHLGDLGHTLQDEQLEEVADADVLLLPIGGHNGINVAQTAEIIGQVEPRVVIPMHYHPVARDEVSGETLNPLDKFCREMGIDKNNTQPKFTITRNTLTTTPPTELQIVLLSPR